MRIFLVLHPSGNTFVPGSATWYRNLYEPLVELGHDIYFFNLNEFVNSNNITFRSAFYKQLLSIRLTEAFRKEFAKKPFDLFFGYLTHLDVDNECLEEIKEYGIPMLNFSCNNTHQFYLTEPIAQYFDYNLHSEKAAAVKFAQGGFKAHWFPMAANPNYYKPLGLSREYDVSFIGMNYAKRAHYIHHLLANNIKTDCFGHGWTSSSLKSQLKKELKYYLKIINLLTSFSPVKKYTMASTIKDYRLTKLLRQKYIHCLHPSVTDDDMIKIFNQSHINLGFLEVYGTDKNGAAVLKQHLHLREFEVPMSGSLYITNYSDELTEFYEPDKEVIVYRSEHELLDKIRFYLKDEHEANIIRQAGYKRALAEHTCQKRLKNLLKSISNGIPA